MRTPLWPSAWGLAVFMAMGLSGCGRSDSLSPASVKPALVRVVLQTDWYAEPEQGGFYEALAKGYYRDAGLDVEINQGGPTTRPEQMIATGQADIGIASSDNVIIDAGRGIPLVIIGAMMQHDPQAIMVHHESGIRSLKELDGRNIMAVPGSDFIPIMENLLHIKVAITPSDFGMSRFLADGNYVQQCFVTNEPYYVRRLGAHVDVFPISECGFDPYRIWYARRDFIGAHPEAVRAFGAASLRGWRDYISGDPEPANALIASLNLKMDSDFMAYSRRMMQAYKLVEGDPAAGEGLGRISRKRLDAQIRQLGEIGLLENPVAVDDILDPRFLPNDLSISGDAR